MPLRSRFSGVASVSVCLHAANYTNTFPFRRRLSGKGGRGGPGGAVGTSKVRLKVSFDAQCGTFVFPAATKQQRSGN